MSTACRTPGSASECPTGSAQCQVVQTERRIRGWIGLQRYLHETEYGLDFIRNGRKIEVGNKDLFTWSDGETSEVEYPIDDPRNRGRFVGEIHLDHCRVSYTKDRFERDDPSWEELIRLIRGEGPLQPNKARQRGYGENVSPLFSLFQAFRRSSPQGKNGLWSRIMVVKNNDRAFQMAEAFAENDPDYLTDERWWQLVEEQDRELLGGSSPQSPTGGTGHLDVPPGFMDEQTDSGTSTTAPTDPIVTPVPPAEPLRQPILELSRKYVHPTYRVEYEVQGYAVTPSDPDLAAGVPWMLKLSDVATRTYAFLVDTDADVFRSTTMTPLDALLTELAHRTVDFLKGHPQDVPLAGVLADFRREYCVESRLDGREIISVANMVLADIARGIANQAQPEDGQIWFNELEPSDQQWITRRMATREVANHKQLISEARFLEYSEPAVLRGFFNRHPELFFDGRYWDDEYLGLDYGAEAVTIEARALLRSRYDAYLVDAVWLANQTPSEIDRATRDLLVRATCSLRLLRPDVAT